jgi:sec-independent protein translocase protein TatA
LQVYSSVEGGKGRSGQLPLNMHGSAETNPNRQKNRMFCTLWYQFMLKYLVMGPIGFNEILIILVIILLLFGAKKIPELMRGMGKGMREFNDARNDKKEDPKPE